MTDFATARRMMVDGQVRPSDITSSALIAAMLALPRERFLPAASAELAYLDLDAPVDQPPGERRMLKPMVLAKLFQTAEIGPQDRVLDVGSLTGYSAALAARLSSEVVALNDDPALTRRAEETLRATGAVNVVAVTGPLTGGYPAKAPFDVIILNGSSEIEPKSLYGQLRDGGRMVGIVGRGRSAKAMLYRCDKGVVTGRAVFDAAAPLLPGFAAPAVFAF
jgi:protein-L-isoaspartate(D-aspartate) O-methyltransferase